MEQIGEHSTRQVKEMFLEDIKIPWYGVKFCINAGGAEIHERYKIIMNVNFDL